MASPYPPWSEARVRSFITSGLRSASMRWPPKNLCLKKARIERGQYLCTGYNRDAHQVPASIVIDGKRKKNVYADHIKPVVDPLVGFISWDSFINRLFCSESDYQILCFDCHQRKSKDEKDIRLRQQPSRKAR